MHASYILWFRPEVVRTVRWGGDPLKPATQGEDGSLRLHPRRSFEIWKETLRGRALPWRPAEVDTAKEMRNAVVGIVLRRAEELASLTEELQRSNKELEAFSYSVSHDLRAPFRHIVGYSELLRKLEGAKLSERGRRYVDTIIESAYTAGTLVDNLLSFSQMGRSALKPRLVDMNALVAEVRQKLELDVGERRVAWRVHDLAAVRADPIMLRLVVENLLANAVKYTRPREEAVIEVDCRRDGDEIVYAVRDNGVGFDMAYVNKLFGVFQRLHKMEDFEGTGIGLANVRRIVERHGGRTWGEGAVDRGAAFYFSLPDPTGDK
jgi:light-regulated signal transduction histidine kinase (bacteriophytochrome)